MRLWREFDMRFFSVPRGAARNALIRKHRTYIIDGINANFQKLYFPSSQQASPGEPVDIQEMTYGGGKLVLYNKAGTRSSHSSCSGGVSVSTIIGILTVVSGGVPFRGTILPGFQTICAGRAKL